MGAQRELASNCSKKRSGPADLPVKRGLGRAEFEGNGDEKVERGGMRFWEERRKRRNVDAEQQEQGEKQQQDDDEAKKM